MDSFIHVAGWSQHMSPHPSPSRPFSHIRSLSSVAISSASPPPSPAVLKPRVPSKSPSTSQLPSFSLSASTPAFSDEMSTLPDPRSRNLDPVANDDGRASPSPTRHPDLNDEVATLSTKLINAINHQTVLDDTLSATRHELNTAHDRIRELEALNASQREIMSGDVWIRRSTLDAEKRAMQTEKRLINAQLAEEHSKRTETEREKRKIEQELENLTTALFEEANKMVIGAKEEAQFQHEILQRKNDQLKSQLADSESLLKSQQEQLSELKQVMECIVTERDDLTNGTAPSSPGLVKPDTRDDDGNRSDTAFSVTSPLPDVFAPAPPTSYQHLIQPVLRTDLSSYDDFMTLTRINHHKRSVSRVSSGSMGGLNNMSLGLGGSTSSAHQFNASTTSLTTLSGPATSSAPQSPNTPASGASPNSGPPATSLKETRFYKRVLVEDIEPTMRLDTAPGLSWLARRTVLSSMTEGTLVVEPVPVSTTRIAITRPQAFPCSLCGESRKDATHLRHHRFRTSEAESAQRYPLCNYCLGRVRSTCGFLGFLRMVKDGHWRADDEDHEKAAWEESVRLRDQMFWSRIGGGVIPTSQAEPPAEMDKSRRPSRDSAVVAETSPRSLNNSLSADIEALQQGNLKLSISEPRTPPAQTDPVEILGVAAESLHEQSSPGSEVTKLESTASS